MPPRNLLVIALTAVVSMACYSVASKNRYANLFAEAVSVIDQQSLKQVPREQLFASAMKGMLSDLDEHSMFISGAMFEQFEEDIRQEFGGVGMYVETDPKTERLTVLAPMPGTPAFEVGLRSGDQIMAIDGVDTLDKSRRDAVKLLRGPIGETVELTIERGDEEMTKSLRRAVIEVASVHGDYRSSDGKWQYKLKEMPQIGYIRLLQFGEKSGLEFKAALADLQNVNGLIIDLRNNSGGLLSVAIDICDMFLPADKSIVKTRVRNQILDKSVDSTALQALDPEIPICVLINRNSASASEIVAGCLQDHRRAVLVGEQSWGKGTVQDVIPMQRGESALKLTTASYWRPSGRHIDRYDDIAKETNVWGVQPDSGYGVEMTEGQVFANIRSRSLRELQGLLSDEEVQRISNNRIERARKAAAEESTGPSEDTSEIDLDEPQVDLPLQRAMEYFRSLEKEKVVAT